MIFVLCQRKPWRRYVGIFGVRGALEGETATISRNQKVENKRTSSELKIRRHLRSDCVCCCKGNSDRRWWLRTRYEAYGQPLGLHSSRTNFAPSMMMLEYATTRQIDISTITKGLLRTGKICRILSVILYCRNVGFGTNKHYGQTSVHHRNCYSPLSAVTFR